MSDSTKSVFQHTLSQMEQAATQDIARRKDFVVNGKQLYIEKWKMSEVFQLTGLITNLFLLPQAASATPTTDEEGVLIGNTVDLGSAVFAFADQMSKIPRLDLVLKDLTSCVYVKETGNPLDYDNDLDDPSELCAVLSEVLKCHFLFLFNGDLTNLIWTGIESGKVAESISQPQ